MVQATGKRMCFIYVQCSWIQKLVVLFTVYILLYTLVLLWAYIRMQLEADIVFHMVTLLPSLLPATLPCLSL